MQHSADMSNRPFSKRASTLLQMPLSMESRLPDGSCTVEKLWDLLPSLPPVGPTPCLPANVLSHHASFVSEDEIYRLHTLPTEMINSLYAEIKMRETTANPVCSVMHPGSLRCFPLWALSFWKRVEHMRLEANAWSVQVDIIQRIQVSAFDSDVVLSTRKLVVSSIHKLPWEGTVEIAAGRRRYYVTAPMLRRILSSGRAGWLNTALVDALMALVRHDVEKDDELHGKVIVCDVSFWERIQRKDYNSRVLTDVVKLVESGHDQIMAPTICDEHWLPFRISFVSDTFTYGKRSNCMHDHANIVQEIP
jgi:hypothetical protein